jgi:hypothetical protein
MKISQAFHQAGRKIVVKEKSERVARSFRATRLKPGANDMTAALLIEYLDIV